MKKFLVGLLVSLSTVLPNFGAQTDSDGMPIVYLRGTFGRQQWGIDEAYRFSRVGNKYTLEINYRNEIPAGKFKIGDEDWNFDFGAPDNNLYIDNSCNQTLVRRGANILTNGFSEGTISFYYTEGQELNVTFDLANDNINPGLGGQLSGSLPVMYINVYSDENHTAFNNEVISYNLSHKNYFENSEYWIDLNGCTWMEEEGAKSIGSADSPLPLQIKARGNWTRIGFSKKPFKIKLDKKQDLLGLTPEKSKHYALLAHADDVDGYLRNYTSFKLGERIGLPWTPKMQPVELVINGNYRGLYFLTESVRVQEGRIEIEELDDNISDKNLVSGGYVVELDNYDEDNQIRMEEKSCVKGQNLDMLRITWDTPEAYSELQKRFVTDQFSAINEAIGNNSDETWSYLDLDDAARYYLVEEIVGDTESYHGSTYLFRDRGEGEKWHFSPLWDAGNAFRGKIEDFFYNCDPFGNTWIPSLRENETFNHKVKETWLWFMQNRYPGLEQELEVFSNRIKDACQSDYKRWKNETVPSGGQPVADNRDMESKLNKVKEYLASKTNWLKGKFGDYTTGMFMEPERDDTPAKELPEYAKPDPQEDNPGNDDPKEEEPGKDDPEASIGSIFDESASVTEYYNLQGQKVLHPQKGRMYIIKTGRFTRKVIL